MENLPVEIHHRIFDHLDAETIFFSLRPVCRLFRAMVQTYNRYQIDFPSISKSNFSCLLRFIPTQGFQKLVLYNTDSTPNQMPIFFSLIQLRQLTCLHSLSLFGIDELDLNYLLKRLNINLLKSFSLKIRKYDDRRKRTTEKYLSLIVSLPTLRRLHLNLREFRISNIKWPVECQIETLIIDAELKYENLCTIFSCSPRLHRLTIKQSLQSLIRNQRLKAPFSQLHSLTIEKLDVKSAELESFLCLTPSLRYLKILGEDCLNNGKKWEEFIHLNLPHLDQFEFFVSIIYYGVSSKYDLKEIIDSFQSPFWIEYKKWFVAGHHKLGYTHRIQIYSLPICETNFRSDLKPKTVLSTAPDFIVNNHINELHISANDQTTGDILNQVLPPYPVLTKLKIELDRRVSRELCRSLENNLSIPNLIEVELEGRNFNKRNYELLTSIVHWLGNSPQLSNLKVQSQYHNYEFYPYLNDLYSILPCQLKHLQIAINEVEQIPKIFERCPNLVVIQLEITQAMLINQVREWFEQNTKGTVFPKQRQGGYEMIWIGKRTDQEEINYKRSKLMDNIDQS